MVVAMRKSSHDPPPDDELSDGTSIQSMVITTNFSQGAWLHFPISVPAGGADTVTVVNNGGVNAVLSGLFLGGN